MDKPKRTFKTLTPLSTNTNVVTPEPKLTKDQYVSLVKKNIGGLNKDLACTDKTQGNNCISGVTNAIKKSTGMNVDDISNISFRDKAKSRGFQTINDSTGYKPEEGDVVQYINRVGTPWHAKLLEGVKGQNEADLLQIGHNAGKEQWASSLNTNVKDLKTSIANKDVVVQKYNPNLITERSIQQQKKQKAREYSDKLYKDRYTKAPLLKSSNAKSREYLNYYNKDRLGVGQEFNIDPDVLNKMMATQLGIAEQETKKGNRASYDYVPEFLLPAARAIKSMSQPSDDWRTDLYNKSADIRKRYKSAQDFKDSDYIKDNPGSYDPKSNVAKSLQLAAYKSRIQDNTPTLAKSKGDFQQKEITKYGRKHNLGLDTKEGQVINSLALQASNYNKLKKMYPNKSTDELIELSVLAHNAPSKAFNKEYTDYYQKNKKMDYVNKVYSKIKYK